MEAEGQRLLVEVGEIITELRAVEEEWRGLDHEQAVRRDRIDIETENGIRRSNRIDEIEHRRREFESRIPDQNNAELEQRL